MPTVFNRAYAFYKVNQEIFDKKFEDVFTAERKIDLGIIVSQDYFKKNFVRRIGKVKSKDYDMKDAMVWYYPAEYKQRLDELISNFFDTF